MKKLITLSVSLLFVLVGLSALSAKNYSVITELPEKIFIKNAGTNMYMEAKNGEIKLYSINRTNRDQQWSAHKNGSNGEFRLRNIGEGKYLNTKTIKTGKLIKKKHEILATDSRPEYVKFLMVNDSRFIIKLSNGKVADAQGGVSKKKQGQAVIPYGHNNGSNQEWNIYYEDGNSYKLFNYAAYMREKKAASNEQNKSSQGSSTSLSQALGSKYVMETYMKTANSSQFINENRGNVLLNHLNKMDATERFTMVDTIVKSASDNRDNELRYLVFDQLAQTNLSGGGFVVNLAKPGFKKNIQRISNQEKYPKAKNALERLMNKY